MTDPIETQELLSEIRAEIEEVHRFISAWFRGEETPSAEAFSAGLADRFAPGLINIQPAGRVLTCETLLSSIQDRHGASPDFRIEIADVALRHVGGDGLVLATYVEKQSGARHSNPENTRISSVLMRRRADDGALEWLHIHETAVPGDPVSNSS